jgi:hypothetical protein
MSIILGYSDQLMVLTLTVYNFSNKKNTKRSNDF